MHVRRLRVVQIMLLSVVLVAGTVTAAPVTTLTVAVITPSLIDAPMVVGAAAGIFEKHGLGIHWRKMVWCEPRGDSARGSARYRRWRGLPASPPGHKATKGPT